MTDDNCKHDSDAYVTCPECKGTRLVNAIGPWGMGGMVHCHICKGEGEISMMHLSELEYGDKWLVDNFGEDGLQ